MEQIEQKDQVNQITRSPSGTSGENRIIPQTSSLGLQLCTWCKINKVIDNYKTCDKCREKCNNARENNVKIRLEKYKTYEDKIKVLEDEIMFLRTKLFEQQDINSKLIMNFMEKLRIK
jgi:hypothetical protein